MFTEVKKHGFNFEHIQQIKINDDQEEYSLHTCILKVPLILTTIFFLA